MSDSLLIQHCSPTLAGIKTGNLFVAEYSSILELNKSIKKIKYRLSNKGITVVPLTFANNKALIYLYRPNHLHKDINNPKCSVILKQAGYDCNNTKQCVKRLISRLSDFEEFPHEIGFFLGYPPDDVIGFIKNHSANYKYSGMWKVYGDVDLAKYLFNEYKKCTNTYTNLYNTGTSIEQLTVAV